MGLVLSLRGVEKRYGSIEVLKGIYLELGEGEAATVRGRSGVGKSTLCRIAALLDEPDAGAVVLEGREVSRLSDRERSRLRLERIGYVDQELTLVPTMSALDNVALPLRLMGVPKGVALERARQLLRELGLGGKEGRFPSQLSAGERQRVVIARALVKRPRLLVLDEPLSCLDDETSSLVVDTLLSYVSTYRCALLMTTTDLGFSLGGKTYILKGGRLVEV